MTLIGGLIWVALSIAIGVALIIFRRQIWGFNASARRAVFGRDADWAAAGGSPRIVAGIGIFAIALGVFVLVAGVLRFSGTM